MNDKNETTRIETEAEVKTYLDRLKYALDNGASIIFQQFRKVEEKKDVKYTNNYTISTLFPNEDPKATLRRELKNLTAEEYMNTVKDLRYPNKSEMRVFGKVYNAKDVYIKIRVELLDAFGQKTTFVMSFHFAEKPFSSEDFPYKKIER